MVAMSVPENSPDERKGKKRQLLDQSDRAQRRKKWRRSPPEVEEIAALEARIAGAAPPSGSNPLAVALSEEDCKVDQQLRPYAGAKLFSQLPLSDRTQRGLKEAKYIQMTAIQRAALPHALCGRDVLGAAKTGSGKTLAFLVPVIEKLFRLRWGKLDGVGAIIISPTRELAVQIFDELKRAGKHHSLSGGLLIGGRKGVEMEKGHVGSLNILVCTPGRLLQHMDETPNFDCSQLQVLVLDEADRILDMGFAGTLNSIVAQLPKQRQTFLFSATQTRSVQDLARLSLQDPEYLAVHAESTAATPARLQQTVMIVPLEDKLDTLWSFVKTHLQSKTLVFLSSCKQVKFVHESFKKLRPGVPIKCLHGRMKQTQRSLVFFDFCESRHALLLATDVAARGLDFPAVDWVLQVDCPEDVATYIHRVGRTARYTASGRSLLFLTPSEQTMLDALKAAKIPIKVIKANTSKVQQVSPALAGLLSKNPELKYLAQRAFVTYLRSIHLRPDKDMFDVTKLPHAEFAASMGLPSMPRIRFLKGDTARKLKNAPRNLKDVSEVNLGEDHDCDDSDGDKVEGGAEEADVLDGHEITAESGNEEHDVKSVQKNSKLDRLFRRKNASVLSATFERMRAHEPSEEDDFIFKSLADCNNIGSDQSLGKKIEASAGDGAVMKSSGVKVSKKKKVVKIDSSKAGNQRLVFDEDGNAVTPFAALATQTKHEQEHGELAQAAEERNKRLREEMKERDKEDRILEKHRLREKRLKKRQKLRKSSEDAEGGGVVIGKGNVSNGRARDEENPFTRGYDNSDEGSDQWDSEEDAGQGGMSGVAHLSLAEKEALALRLLSTK